ncbi:bifunctional orotidine-5'-phosphate decarboxylase/orotate phosphoribosyltransferase [Synechococcus moorigangaii CMS01]|nr:bifunctional orotidine-5'-phosphate decarboxylase/orotate phosphoribosyltransferase [Synechococcus moorigangaii CMS01]
MELTHVSFTEKLTGAIAAQKTLLVAGLDPNPEMLPLAWQRGDLLENLKIWLLGIIEQTQDLVCAYKPTLGFYQALGGPGLQLLETVLAHIPPEIPVILDAKHADLNTSSLFAQASFESWCVDAVTLSAYPGQDHIAPFLRYADKGVFLQCRTSNPGARNIQDYPNPQKPFYLHLIQEIKQWGTPEQLFLEIGSDRPEIFQQARRIAPERWILARSIWQRSENLEEIIHQGLNSDGSGLLIPIPNDDLSQADCRTPVTRLRGKIETIRRRYTPSNAHCDLLQAPTDFPAAHPEAELIVQLFDVGCLLFGEYVQASGATFSYYIDLRKIISNPQVFNQVLNAYGAIAQNLTFDRIAGIPYGSLPTATGLALKLNYPMIYPRKEVKAHGTRRVIEGHFEPGERILVVDDVLITGKSIVEGANKLESAGLTVGDMIVLIDHEGGVKAKIETHGYEIHAILTISEITETLFQAGRINKEQYQALLHS